MLEKELLPLQDTNDNFLANMQKDGSYSVVPRIPGGEITADKLLVIGTVAKKYNLYTKITGGQRIDLLGIRKEDLPQVWADLEMPSGSAYGKLRISSIRSLASRVDSGVPNNGARAGLAQTMTAMARSSWRQT